MKPLYVSIEQEKTGNRIEYLMKQRGYRVRDIQEVMGFSNPQAVYKWLRGESLPSIDNLVILSLVLHTSIENILVLDEDVLPLFGTRAAQENLWLTPNVSRRAKQREVFQVLRAA